MFAAPVLHCGDCGARRQVIVLTTDADPIQRTLTHLGLAAQPPASPRDGTSSTGC